jgi:hypothetical protein
LLRLLEPIHELVELDESVVIPYRINDSYGSKQCGNPNIVLPLTVAGFAIRVI